MNAATKHHLRAPIADVEQLTPDLFRLVLETPEVAATCRPGQFVNIKISDEDYPLLRRPLSIHHSDGESRIEIIFRVVGQGTRLLADRRVGESLDLIGPLGEPFRLDPERRALLVGGGVGVPPIHALFWEARKQTLPHVALIGLRTSAEIGLAGRMPEFGENCLISTDDGSLGHHGFVTELLLEHLESNVARESACAIYACGPTPLLERIIAICQKRAIPGQVSFEQQMSCGIGACIGCSIETNRGYRRVCSEGPVFDAKLFYK